MFFKLYNCLVCDGYYIFNFISESKVNIYYKKNVELYHSLARDGYCILENC